MVFKKEAIKAKSRKLKAGWSIETEEWTVPRTLHKEFEHLPDEDLPELYSEVYDRWNFETGSEEDLKTMKKLEEEIKHRHHAFQISDELVKTMAKEISNEIDNSILKELFNQDIENERTRMVSNQE